MSKEDREERVRIQKLRENLAVIERSLLVEFNENAAVENELVAIRSMTDVESASQIFHHSAVVFARKKEQIDQLMNDIAAGGTVKQIIRSISAK